jgi:hypothetical protein
MVPFEFAQAKAPASKLPPMDVCISGTLSQFAVCSALSIGTIFGTKTNFSVANAYTPMLALPIMLVK